MISSSLHEIAWLSTLAAVAAFVFFRGGRPEVLGITGVLVAELLSLAASSPIAHVWSGVHWLVVVANTETVAVALYVLWKSSRWWPLFSVAFQGVSLLFYLVPIFDPEMRARAYYVSSIGFDYLNLAVIALGTLLEGPKAWLPFSPSRR